MSDIFFTADTHFHHKAIIGYTGRPFSSVSEMDNTLINNWNSVVKPRDTVYHLGDFCFGNGVDVFNALNGQKFLIRGNHDKYKNLRLGWGWIKDVYMFKAGNSMQIWLSHYPHRSWKNMFHGSWHLFGHTHGALPPYGKSFDVGVDANGYQLWHLDSIILTMQELENTYD